MPTHLLAFRPAGSHQELTHLDNRQRSLWTSVKDFLLTTFPLPMLIGSKEDHTAFSAIRTSRCLEFSCSVGLIRFPQFSSHQLLHRHWLLGMLRMTIRASWIKEFFSTVLIGTVNDICDYLQVLIDKRYRKLWLAKTPSFSPSVQII